MEHYPEAKVVLSIRSAESWWKSAQATFMSADSPVNREVNLPNAQEFMRNLQIIGEAAGGGINWDGSDREGAIAAFERHNAEVRRVVPVPDMPYPRTNSTEEVKETMRQLIGD